VIIKEVLTKDRLLDYSTDIFRYYFRSDLIGGKYYPSPFRKEKVPSFNMYNNKNKGYLVYKDWGGTFGNAIDFVMRLYNMDFREAMIRIVVDLRLPFITDNSIVDTKLEFKRALTSKKEYDIMPNLLGTIDNPLYDSTDAAYWSKMFIPTSYLIKHDVYSLLSYYINKLEVRRKEGNPIYLYLEYYNDKVYYKLYKPKAEGINKWKSNMTDVASKIYHNIHKIPAEGDLLIITKSVKDNVVLSYLGYNAISGQGEDIPLDVDIIDDLKKRYKQILIFYDNDFSKEVNYGIEAAKREAIKHQLNYIFIPDKFECKDISDLACKMKSITSLKLIINEIIKRSNKQPK